MLRDEHAGALAEAERLLLCVTMCLYVCCFLFICYHLIYCLFVVCYSIYILVYSCLEAERPAADAAGATAQRRRPGPADGLKRGEGIVD